MARKDELLRVFLEHEILKEKYKIESERLPTTLSDALVSDVPIVKAIALIVSSLESGKVITDNSLRNTILQYLNESAL